MFWLPIVGENEGHGKRRDLAGDTMEFEGLVAVVRAAQTLEALGMGVLPPGRVRIDGLDAGASIGDDQLPIMGLDAMLFESTGGFPLEQARVIRLLVDTVTVMPEALQVSLRAQGLHSLIAETETRERTTS